MTKIKKSFFERLTGSRKIGEDEIEFEREQTIIRPTNNTNIYSEEAEAILSSAPRQIMREESRPSFPQEDGEGQLTIDVYQTDNEIIIKSTIAGVKPEDLDVSISNDMITIQGERRRDEDIPEENYYYQECYWGSFSRSVILPVDVIADKIEASMKNGILTIKMLKADNTRTKKIQVRGF